VDVGALECAAAVVRDAVLWALTVGRGGGAGCGLIALLGVPAALGDRPGDGPAWPVAHPASAHASTTAAARRASTPSTLAHGAPRPLRPR
jgi:hypothetical protein